MAARGRGLTDPAERVDRSGHAYSPASLDCAAAMPLTLLDTSSGTGWCTLLLDHLGGAGDETPFDTHPTDDVTVTICAAGRPTVVKFVNGRWQSALFQPGVIRVIPPGETARMAIRAPDDAEPFRMLHLYLPGALFAEIRDNYSRTSGAAAHACPFGELFRDELLARTAAALLAACRNGAPDLYAAGAARWIATHLLASDRNGCYVADDVRLATTITDRRLSRVVEYMSSGLDQPLSLTQLACEAGISVHHFGRRFRERTGIGPASYLTELRMQSARRLLRTTDLSIAEIARRCGYPRPSTFSTAFLRRSGLSPTAYRTGMP